MTAFGKAKNAYINIARYSMYLHFVIGILTSVQWLAACPYETFVNNPLIVVGSLVMNVAIITVLGAVLWPLAFVVDAVMFIAMML